jgi:hypothetical protein
MTFFNPLSGSLVPATPVQRAADKDRQIARSQALRKNAAAEGEHVEHQVESADELHAAGDQSGGGNAGGQQGRLRKKPTDEDGKPHIDVKA